MYIGTFVCMYITNDCVIHTFMSTDINKYVCSIDI